MEPKEKANEMYLKFRDTNGVIGAAKQCAIIAVKEVINSHNTKKEIDYWNEVLKEVNAFYSLK